MSSGGHPHIQILLHEWHVPHLHCSFGEMGHFVHHDIGRPPRIASLYQ